MVFFSSCASVKYHQELLNYIDIPVESIHVRCILRLRAPNCADFQGKQKQQKRTCTFFSFGEMKSGILLCTDVAARGLDIPKVDWIVQYDPPDEPNDYIHRVGRTARGATGTGHALLILRPEELGFLRYLKAANVKLSEYEFSWSKIPNIQPQLEKIVAQNYYLNKSAKEGYKWVPPLTTFCLYSLIFIVIELMYAPTTRMRSRRSTMSTRSISSKWQNRSALTRHRLSICPSRISRQ